MEKIITIEQMSNMKFDEILNLYRQGYKLSETTEISLCPDCPSIYPAIDNILPHSKSGYNFA